MNELSLEHTREPVSSVPEVTLAFWLIKIAATTLGETGRDALSLSMNLGCFISTAVFAVLLAQSLTAQLRATTFNPTAYWLGIVATTSVGASLVDFADHALGVGYSGLSALLLFLLTTSIFLWYRSMDTVALDSVSSPKALGFYWAAVMCAQALGSALVGWIAGTVGTGYWGAMLFVGGLLSICTALYLWSYMSHTLLFWIAFVLTRPLGTFAGDFLDRASGLNLNPLLASAVVLALIVAFSLLFPQAPARRPR